MLSQERYIQKSVGIHLFFARIMMEHAFFLQTGFMPKDSSYIQEADVYRRQFAGLLGRAISLSGGAAEPGIIQSEELVTPYTLNAEMASAYFTGVQIFTNLTRAEQGLRGGNPYTGDPAQTRQAEMLNENAVRFVTDFIQYKRTVLSDTVSCKIITSRYPMMIEHLAEEAEAYLNLIRNLENGEDEEESALSVGFWNEIMAEHAKFIRGLLDPSEEALFRTADRFAGEFDKLSESAAGFQPGSPLPAALTEESLKATEAIREFKEQATKGLLECKIKSIIIPLLSDHVLREANHFLRLLK